MVSSVNFPPSLLSSVYDPSGVASTAASNAAASTSRATDSDAYSLSPTIQALLDQLAPSNGDSTDNGSTADLFGTQDASITSQLYGRAQAAAYVGAAEAADEAKAQTDPLANVLAAYSSPVSYTG